MNAAAKALAQNSFVVRQGRSIVITPQIIGLLMLIVAVLASALSVVYIKDLDRQLFSQLQMLDQARDGLRVEWGQLLLEQNTWAAPARVQALAQNQLGMVFPDPKDVVLVSVKSS